MTELRMDDWLNNLTDAEAETVNQFINLIDDDMLLEMILKRTGWIVGFETTDIEKESEGVDGMVLGTRKFIQRTVKNESEFVLLSLGANNEMEQLSGELH